MMMFVAVAVAASAPVMGWCCWWCQLETQLWLAYMYTYYVCVSLCTRHKLCACGEFIRFSTHRNVNERRKGCRRYNLIRWKNVRSLNGGKKEPHRSCACKRTDLIYRAGTHSEMRTCTILRRVRGQMSSNYHRIVARYFGGVHWIRSFSYECVGHGSWNLECVYTAASTRWSARTKASTISIAIAPGLVQCALIFHKEHVHTN